MSLFPLFANLEARPVLVLGGGVVAARKVEALLEAGAEVHLAAPELTHSLRALVQEGHIQHLQGPFRSSWLDDKWLAVVATSDTKLNALVARHAQARRLLVNVVDDATLSSFHSPARLRRGPFTVAISSGGQAPALARRLRAQLETSVDETWGPLGDLAARHRQAIRHTFPDLAARRRFHDWLLDGPVSEHLRRARAEQAEQSLLEALARNQPPVSSPGHVTLVGAGPGDPGLLTIKALRALQQADVIVHDRLVGNGILDLARRDAVRIDMGKRVGGDHEATQSGIHQLLLKHAQAGEHVVRLKGGDSLIFGRGGEELEFLRAHGIAYDVVPGISAAIACAAYAGVPLTHRDHSQSLHLATVHRKQVLRTQDWAALAREHHTLALYMPVSQLEEVTRQLLAHGRSHDTPFALVENGTRPEQRVVTGPLHALPDVARQHAIKAPALLLIGETAALATQLGWFGRCIPGDTATARAA